MDSVLLALHLANFFADERFGHLGNDFPSDLLDPADHLLHDRLGKIRECFPSDFFEGLLDSLLDER